MEETSEKFNQAIWFAIGYFAALLIELAAEELIRFLNKAVTTTPPALAFSENGTTGVKGETVTSLVKEPIENE
jgi:hypothetical protein